MDIYKLLTEEQKKIVELCSSLVEEFNVNAYLVGGAVRDLFLQKAITDLDICIEGDGVAFARALNQHLIGNLKIYDDFMTCTITLPSLTQVDIITNRKESYPVLGQLPKVKAGNIYDDLKRRDFTINSVAIKIDKMEKLQLIDPLGGIKDIKGKQIRVLHRKSFLEDPTRIFRAIRLAERLNFNLEPLTYSLLKIAIMQINTLSPERMKSEFIRIINEGKAAKILKVLEKYKITKELLPGTQLKKLSHKRLDKAKEWFNKENDFNLYLTIILLIYWQCAENKKDILRIRWEFTKKEKRVIDWFVDNDFNINFLLSYPEHVTQLHLYRLLDNAPREAKIFLLSLRNNNDEISQKIAPIKTKVQLPLDGKDLLHKGIPLGPMIGKILNELEDEVINGRINCKKEALEWLELNHKK